MSERLESVVEPPVSHETPCRTARLDAPRLPPAVLQRIEQLAVGASEDRAPWRRTAASVTDELAAESRSNGQLHDCRRLRSRLGDAPGSSTCSCGAGLVTPATFLREPHSPCRTVETRLCFGSRLRIARKPARIRRSRSQSRSDSPRTGGRSASRSSSYSRLRSAGGTAVRFHRGRDRSAPATPNARTASELTRR